VGQEKEVDQSLEVGTLSGNFGVSSTGAATYTIPIDLPQGRTGMTPNLGVAYTSQSGNGLLGWGTTLTGLSAISRTKTTHYHDGYIDALDFDSNDQLTFDGQRLILVKVNGSEKEYRTEIESFSKIVSYGTSGSGPLYFKVWTKSGQIIEYGFTEDSRIQALDKDNNQRSHVLTWLINKIYDRKGNYTEYKYIEENGIGSIEYIKYAANANSMASAEYKVEFNYTSGREDKILNYIGGSRLLGDQLLSSIKIKYIATGSILNSYQFSYDQGFYTHLENVQVFAGDLGTLPLNPTIFEWGQNNHMVQEETYNYDETNVDEFFIDYNGDGKTDIIEATFDVVLYPNPAGNKKVYKEWYYRKRINAGFSNRISLPGNIDKFFSYILIGDYNGDGLQDFLTIAYTHENYDDLRVSQMYLSNGNGFDQQILSGIVINPSNEPELVIGDFDGNGISELLLSYKDIDPNINNTFIWQFKDSYPYYDIVFENKINFGNTDLSSTTLLAGEFNGDGKTDLMQTDRWGSSGGGHSSKTIIMEVDIPNNEFKWIYSTEFPTVWHRIFPGDFNGDGITDILTYALNNSTVNWEINCFNGSNAWVKFDDPPIDNFDPYDGLDQWSNGIKLSDFNGDGKTDLAKFKKFSNDENVADYTIYYSKGWELDKTNTTTGEIQCYGGLDFFGGSYYVKHISQHLNADFNGDGKFDLYSSAGFYDDKVYLFGFNNDYNQLLGFTNGFGNTTSISYKPLTDPTVYTKSSGSTYPINDIQVSMYVVNKVTPDKEFGEKVETNYHYTGARIHKLGKGFLGFKQVKTSDNLKNIETITYNSLYTKYVGGKTYYYYPYSSKSIQNEIIGGVEGQKLVETFNIFDVKNTTTNNNYIFMPVVTNSLQHTWDNDKEHSFIKTTKSKVSISDIDQYGNIKKQIVLVDPEKLEWIHPDNNYDYKTTSEASFASNIEVEDWLINRPDYTKTTKYSREGGTDDILKTVYNYYGKRYSYWPLVESVSTTPNNNSLFTTKVKFNSYDVYGNLLSKTLSAPNSNPLLDSKTTKYEYSTKYNSRFLTKTTLSGNGISYETIYNYYPEKGLLKEEEILGGIQSLVTSYEYDNFGKLFKTTYPDKTTSEITYNFLQEQIGPAKSLFTTSIKEKGNEKVSTVKYFDKFERELKTTTVGLSGMIAIQNIYREGKLLQTSIPYDPNKPPVIGDPLGWTTFRYDNLGRVLVQISPMQTTTYTYSGLKSSTTNNNTGISVAKQVNAIGQVVLVTDPTGTISYKYLSSGNVGSINALGSNTIMNYDAAGNQTKLIDANAGTTSYVYNAYGELTKQTDSKGNIYDMVYDQLGRLRTKTLVNLNEVTYYNYNERIGTAGFGSLSSIEGSNKIIYRYSYDDLERLTLETENIEGKQYSYNYTYSKSSGRLETYTYPSGFKVKYEYDNTNGIRKKVIDAASNNVLWEAVSENSRGQLTNYKLGNGLNTLKEFDEYGFPKYIRTISNSFTYVQNLNYEFEAATGNLLSRYDALKKLKESFTYDKKLNSRLISWQVTGQRSYDILYEDNGNIFQKTDVNNYGDPLSIYQYGDNAGPHALTKVLHATENYENQATPQQIAYTAFHKTKSIIQTQNEADGEHRYTIDITYGPDQARKKTVYARDRQILKTKYHIGGDYEIEIDADGNERKLHYISARGGLFAIYEVSGGNKRDRFLYTHKDHLGSLETITNDLGDVVENLSFDPWGRRRNPNDWTFNKVPTLFLFDRGYTTHEHYEVFGIINMNGRCYDPWLGRMLSPDNYVQAAGYSQNYNRYSYAYNNPLKYTDPDGEWVHIVIGAAIGGVVNLGIKAYQGKINSVADGFVAFGIGAVAGAVGAATGGVAFAAAGGAAGGVGGFLAGAGGGAMGSAFSMPLQSVGNSAYFGDPLMTGKDYLLGIGVGVILGGGVNGGIAAFKGGNFWTGKAIAPGRGSFSLNNTSLRDQGQISTMQSKSINAFNNNYDNPSQIKLPKKLYHYTPDDPSEWTSIGRLNDPNKTNYFTINKELNKVTASIDLALPKVPNFRIDVPSSNFDPSKILIIRSVNGNVFNKGGGGWEILYKGPLAFDKSQVIITPLN
jgi:RHS repeat-associated protein